MQNHSIVRFPKLHEMHMVNTGPAVKTEWLIFQLWPGLLTEFQVKTYVS